MAQFYEMPAISPTMEMGTLVEWKVAEGESFPASTVLAEVGTDKANMDAEIFDEGVLIKHLVPVDAEIPPGFPIAIWGQSVDEDITELLATFKTRKAELEGGKAPAPETKAEKKAPEQDSGADDGSDDDAKPKKGDDDKASKPAKKSPSPTITLGKIEREWMGKRLGKNFQDVPGDIHAASAAVTVKASPLAKKIAKDKGLDLAKLTGSGPGGRILAEDVENGPAPAVAGGGAAARADGSVKNTPMRKTIAKRLLQSHTDIPVFFLTATFDMQGFVDLRTQLKAAMPDVKVSYNDILIKAVARSLSEHPFVNAQWTPDAIIQKGSIDIGVAVALPAGLITPVVRHADQKGLSAIGAEVRELAGRAKSGKLQVEEYTGSTFTISNLGMMEIEQFTAIINPPEVAILAVGSIDEVPVVKNGALATGWRMKVTMSCDHRVIDGAVGASFLQTLRRYVETPALLLV